MAQKFMQLFQVQGNNNKENLKFRTLDFFTSGAKIGEFQTSAAFYFGGVKKKWQKNCAIVWLTAQPEQF